MFGFELSEWISLPPERVFEFITEPDHAPQIVPSVRSTVKLTEGPVAAGSRFLETRLMSGREHQAELEVKEYEAPHLFAMQNTTEGIETLYRYKLRPERDGTRVDLVCEVKASGIKKLMLPMVVSILKREDGDHLKRLKKLLEGG